MNRIVYSLKKNSMNIKLLLGVSTFHDLHESIENRLNIPSGMIHLNIMNPVKYSNCTNHVNRMNFMNHVNNI